MAVSYINVGTVPNDGTGDPLRDAFVKINTDFSGLYNFRTTASVNPTGILTPDYVGEEVLSTLSGLAWWKAVNTANTGWAAISFTRYSNESYDFGTVP